MSRPSFTPRPGPPPESSGSLRLLSLAGRRFLWRHPWQVSLTVLGVALGVGVVVAMDLAMESARRAFRLSAEAVGGRATHWIVGSGGGVPDSVYAALRVRGGVRPAAPVVEEFVGSPALPGRALRVLGVDPLAEGPFRRLALGGEGVEALWRLLGPGGGAFLGRETAWEAGVGVGDSLPVAVAGRVRHVQVVGLLEAGDELSRQGMRGLVLMDVGRAQELLGKVGTLDRVDLLLPAGEEGERRRAEIQQRLPPGLTVREAEGRGRAFDGMLRAFQLNLTALSLLALLFGGFLIFNTMTFSVVQRRPFLGILRTLGVTRGEVTKLVLGEAVLLGAAGTALGLVLGVFLGTGLVKLVTRTINDLYFVLEVQGVSPSPSLLGKGVVLGVGVAVLASLPPALEAAGSPARLVLLRSILEEKAARAVPLAALAGGASLGMGLALLALPSRSVTVGFGALFGVVLGFALLTPMATALLVQGLAGALRRRAGPLAVLAVRGLVGAMSRTAPAMAALVMAVAVTVGLGTMIGSFRRSVDRWLDTTLQADLYISAPGLLSSRAQGTLDPEVVEGILSLPEVAGFNTYREIRSEDQGGGFRLLALRLDPRGEKAFDFRQGGGVGAFEAFRGGEGVLVSEPLAYRRGWRVGDEVAIATDSGPRRFRVAGVFRDYSSEQGVVMVDRGVFERWWRMGGVTSLGLFLREGVAQGTVAERIEGLAARQGQSLVVRSTRDLKAASLGIFDRTFTITVVLRLLAFGVAFTGVLSALMALQLERSRELGVLRALGMTPRELWGMITAQTGLLGLMAGVLAVPAGASLAAILVQVVNRRSFGWTLDLSWGLEVFGQAVLLALVGAGLAGAYPAWRMAKTPPALALRDE